MSKTTLSLSKKAQIGTLLVLLPIAAMLVYGHYILRDYLRTDLLEDVSMLSESFEGQVYEYLEMSRRNAENYASDGAIIDGLGNALNGRPGASAALGKYLAGYKLPLNHYLKSISVISLDGRVVSSTDKKLAGADVSKKAFFLDARARGLFFSEFEGNGAPEEPVMAITAPVYGRPGSRKIGYLTNIMLLSEIDGILNGEFVKATGVRRPKAFEHKTLDVYLVNRDGLFLTRSRFIKDAIMKSRVDTAPVRECASADAAVSAFYQDYRGVEVAGASKCLPHLKWTLIAELDSSEVQSPSSDAMGFTLLLLTAVFTVMLLFIAVFFRKIAARLDSIAAAARRVASGDYAARLPSGGPRDEIGVLAGSFNTMASEVDARTQALTLSQERFNEAQHIAHIGSWEWDIEGGSLFWSDEAYNIFGRLKLDFSPSYEAFLSCVHADDRGAVAEAVNMALYGPHPYSIEHRIVRPDGSVRTVHESARVFADAAGTPVRMAGTVQDVTERRRTEEEVKSIARFPEEDPDPVLRVSIDGVLLYANPASACILGEYGCDVGSRLPDSWGAMVCDYLKSTLPAEHEVVFGQKAFAFVFSPKKGADYVNVYGRDLTAWKRAEFELRKLTTAIEQSVNIVFITDVKGAIEYVNPMFERVTEYTREEAIGRNPRILSSGDVTDEQYEVLWKTLLAGKTWRSVYKNRKKGGGYYWSNTVITPIRSDSGVITHFLSVQEDVTEKMISEERIQRLAKYDDLTGLINRQCFMEQLEHWISAGAGKTVSGALFILDTDHFRLLNDTYGNGMGDLFLRRTAAHLKNSMRGITGVYAPGCADSMLLGRLSGDEFAVFVPEINAATAAAMAEDIRRCAQEFRFVEAPASLTLSIGLALFPGHGTDVRTLFTRADAAMCRAKELGRNRFHVYRPDDRDLETIRTRYRWKVKIQEALKQDRFEPWFQPILDLNDGSVHHFEALARLRDEGGAIMLPGAFIDVAERFGLIGGIDRMMLEKVLKFQASERAQGRNYSFGMNLSGKDLGDEGLLQLLKDKITETGADPASLIFEITETAAISDLGAAIKFVSSLKSMGCRFSLDDFGVGFTSFLYLKEMGLDYIKIDGSFIRKLNENPSDQVFVKAMTGLARGLGIKSIAEFVENGETLQLLKAFGVDYAQGYLIGRPAPALERKGLSPASPLF